MGRGGGGDSDVGRVGAMIGRVVGCFPSRENELSVSVSLCVFTCVWCGNLFVSLALNG